MTARIACFLLATAVASVSANGAFAQKLEITVKGIKSGKGRLLIGVYPDSERWDSDLKSGDARHACGFEKKDNSFQWNEKSPPGYVQVPAKAGSVVVTLQGLPEGQYAIRLFHDENSNGKLDKVAGVLPKEPYGFSKDFDPVVQGRAPKWQECLLEKNQPSTAITLR